MALVLSINHWRPYLIERKFVVQIDQKSLRHLLNQTVLTPDQQNWIAKLLGYDFSIVYKPGAANKAVDALSRCREGDFECNAISIPVWIDWGRLET